MPALVAIEVAAPESEPVQLVAEMLGACNSALPTGSCVYSLDRPEAASRVARVAWPTRVEAVITLTEAGDGSAPPIVRTLRFTPDDDPREKWRTVGFTTALMAQGDPLAPAEVPRAIGDVPYVAGLSGHLVLASGLDAPARRQGGKLRLDVHPWNAPFVVGVFTAYSNRPWSAPGVQGAASWTDIGVGAAAMLYGGTQLQLWARAEVLAQRLASGGSKKDKEDAAALWQPGGQLELALSWRVHPRWYAVLGAQVVVVTAPVDLRVEDKAVVHVPQASGGLNLGMQVRF